MARYYQERLLRCYSNQTLRTLIVIGLLTIYVAGHHGQKKQTQPSNVQQTGQNGPKQSAFPITKPTSTGQERPSYQKAKDYLKRAFGPEFLAAWILVIAAGIGIVYTIRTLRILNESAEATKIAAEAAKLSAEALINSERAWIDGELVRETFPAVRYRLKITNHGKTPARMLGFEIDCGCLSEGTEFSREGLSHNYAGKLHFLLGADKSRLLEEVEPLNMHVIFGGCLVAGAYCVTIRYADVVTEGQNTQARETSFIYYCRFLLSLERISDYDKYT
jgi:hypothetical protein